MNLSSLAALIPGILNVAEKVAPLVIPGAGPAVEAAKAAIDLIDAAKHAAGPGEDVTQLEAARAGLEARVNAHAQAVERELNGG